MGFGAPGVTGRGAETPAISEPNPSFCKLRASIFPVASKPCSPWNFCIAAVVVLSHFPFGVPW